MIKMVLLGTGNVATHLFKAFLPSKKVNVIQVYNHRPESLNDFKSETSVTTELEKTMDADIYLLALKDDKISEISSKLQTKKGLVAHTSGTSSLEDLKNCERKAVFYPLQTFSKNREMEYDDIPFCLEANNTKDIKFLKELADEISGKSYEISSAQRKRLHLAAVFVCNFVNHLYAMGENICKENNIPFEILQPLIQETAEKVKASSPENMQTGPALRNDQSTINTHLNLLSSSEEKEIYTLLTKAIQTSHGKKL